MQRLMRLATRTDYAIAAMFELAIHYHQGYIPVAELAERQQIPRAFLEQLLLKLKRAGLTRSRRGPQGGYGLALPPGRIRMSDILNAVDDPLCLPSGASDEAEPMSHPTRIFWLDLEHQIHQILYSMTLQDLCIRARKHEKHRVPPHNLSFVI